MFYQVTYNDNYEPSIQRWPLDVSITANFMLVGIDTARLNLGTISINPSNHRMHISLTNGNVELSGAVFFFDPV